MSTSTPPPKHVPPSTAHAPIDPNRLTVDQMRGLACALCGARLYQSRLIDIVRIGEGVHADDVQLYACNPPCAPLQARLTPPAWCPWCRNEIADDDRVMVGVTETRSGPAYPVYACINCRVAYRIMPFADHPPDTDGRPRTIPRRIAL